MIPLTVDENESFENLLNMQKKQQNNRKQKN